MKKILVLAMVMLIAIVPCANAWGTSAFYGSDLVDAFNNNVLPAIETVEALMMINQLAGGGSGSNPFEGERKYMFAAYLQLSFDRKTSDGCYYTNADNAIELFKSGQQGDTSDMIRLTVDVGDLSVPDTFPPLVLAEALEDIDGAFKASDKLYRNGATWKGNTFKGTYTESSSRITVELTRTDYEQKLAKGSKGEDVKAVQERLSELGYDVGTPDGVYGKKTAAAVSQFQSENGLEANGVVTDPVWNALFPDD